MKFKRAHVSGRFDESVAAWRRAVLYYIALCEVLAVTEIDRNIRALVLQQIGWNSIHGDKGPRDDCGIATKKSKFTVIEEDTHTLSHRRYRNERGDEADTTEAAYQVVKDENEDVLVIGSIHTPHGMTEELRKGEIRSDVAHAYVDIVAGYFAYAIVLMDKHGATRAALSGDWNLNFREPWVRTWFAKNYPGWHLNWDPKHMPAKGTHGREIIDATFLKGLHVVGQPKILRDDPHDDHTGYVETLEG